MEYALKPWMSAYVPPPHFPRARSPPSFHPLGFTPPNPMTPNLLAIISQPSLPLAGENQLSGPSTPHRKRTVDIPHVSPLPIRKLAKISLPSSAIHKEKLLSVEQVIQSYEPREYPCVQDSKGSSFWTRSHAKMYSPWKFGFTRAT